MTSHDSVAALRELRGLAKFFAKKLDEEVLADYVEALSDLDYHAFEEALVQVRRTSKYFPRPSEIRKVVKLSSSSPQRQPFVPNHYEVDPETGERVRVYVCLRCEDGGWRPACGCDLGHLGRYYDAGMCPDHPRVVNGTTYRQLMTACECRGSNLAWQAQTQRPVAGRGDEQ